MATIKIKGATVNITECRARELAKLLAQYGIPFSYETTPMKKENVLMKSLCISHRLQRVLELPNWYISTGEYRKATIEDFLAKFPTKESIIRLHGIGKMGVQYLENALQQHGYEFKGE